MADEQKLDYAFSWLTFGKVQLEQFGAAPLPQKAASAWSGAAEGIAGASYKPLIYLGKQVVKGTNYFFVAEQTLLTNPIVRRVVRLTINEFESEYEIVDVAEILG